MIVFFDPKHSRGGGQVVLEELLRRCPREHPPTLVMPTAGLDSISSPETVTHFESSAKFVRGVGPDMPLTLVCNATSALPDFIRTASKLRRSGHPLRTIAILHNYPTVAAKRLATIKLLQHVDVAVAVEPGLTALRADARIPSWLSVQDGAHARELSHRTIRRTGAVKCYARPDRSKGLHLLPKIFPRLESYGLTCQVAVGDAPFQRQATYRRRLESALAPWIVDGRRGPDWLDPGDIFLVPSIGGEAACLAAQEALSNGAFVIAARVGLMAYLSPTREGMRTFAVADPTDAVRSVSEVVRLDDEAFSAELCASTWSMAARAGRWYEEVMDLIVAEEEALSTDES